MLGLFLVDAKLTSKSSVVLELGAGLLPTVPKVDHAFLESIAKDPDVVDWLISVSDKEGTRSDYLVWLSRFLKWTGWKPADIFTFKREAMRQGEPQCEVEAQYKRFHESLRKMRLRRPHPSPSNGRAIQFPRKQRVHGQTKTNQTGYELQTRDARPKPGRGSTLPGIREGHQKETTLHTHDRNTLVWLRFQIRRST